MFQICMKGKFIHYENNTRPIPITWIISGLPWKRDWQDDKRTGVTTMAITAIQINISLLYIVFLYIYFLLFYTDWLGLKKKKNTPYKEAQ